MVFRINANRIDAYSAYLIPVLAICSIFTETLNLREQKQTGLAIQYFTA